MHFGIRCYPDGIAGEGAKEIIAKLSSLSHCEYVHLPVNAFQKPTPYVLSSGEEGAVCFTPSPKFYEGSKIKPTRAKQFGSLDVLSEVCKEARKKGIQVYAVVNCLINQVALKRKPEYAQLSSAGERSDGSYPFMCFNNPSVERYMLSLTSDVLSNYDVAGVELEKLHYSITSSFRTGNLTCFCKYCRAEARNQGINLDGVKRRLVFFPKPFGEPQRIMEAAGSNPFSVSLKILRSWASLLGLSSWLQHRRHMVSEINGRMMIASRQANADALIGIDLCPSEVSWIAGHDYRALGKNLDCLYPIIEEPLIHRGGNSIANELRSLRRTLRGVMREVKVYPLAVFSPSVTAKETVNLVKAASEESNGLVLHAYGQISVENLKAFGQTAKKLSASNTKA
ncbi:MAG: hypothetical protein WED04_00815 [Promethearchaeati archaeon SRVP18_Atabeyarchaeia-1]